MPDRLQRLLSSVANQHNVFLLALIAVCVGISILPFYSSTPIPTVTRKSNVIAVVKIDTANYSRLYEDYLKLNASFNDLRSQVISLTNQSKSRNVTSATCSSPPTQTKINQGQALERIEKLSLEQPELQRRVEQVQKQIAASQPVPRSFFQDQRVVTDLFTKLHNIEVTANNTNEKLIELQGTNRRLFFLVNKAKSLLIQQQPRKPMPPRLVTKPAIDHAQVKQLIEDEIRKQMRNIHMPASLSTSVSEALKEVDIMDFDFALATAGAEPLAALTSPTYVSLPAQVKSFAADLSRMIGFSSHVQDVSGGGLLGSPWDAINTITTPGSCWPMQSSSGNLTLRLDHPVIVSAVSIDHISRLEAVDARSAPKAFAVYTASSTTDLWRLRFQGEYDLLSSATQTFHFSEQQTAHVDFVRLEILTNHGHPDYTCLYRFRVHGRI